MNKESNPERADVIKEYELCQVCGVGQVVKKIVDEVVRYEGCEAVIPDYTIYECLECGESVPSPESLAKAKPIVCDLHRKAERMLTSAEIRNIRESLGFSQDKFGVLLGGGLKAFARYEKGSVMQSRAMDNLLRILRREPQVIFHLEGEEKSTTDWIRVISYQFDSTPRRLFRVSSSCASYQGEAA